MLSKTCFEPAGLALSHSLSLSLSLFLFFCAPSLTLSETLSLSLSLSLSARRLLLQFRDQELFVVMKWMAVAFENYSYAFQCGERENGTTAGYAYPFTELGLLVYKAFCCCGRTSGCRRQLPTTISYELNGMG